MKQQCTNCQTVNPGSNAFCVNCGTGLRPVTGPLKVNHPTPGLGAGQTGPNNRGLIYGLAGVLATLIVASAAVVLLVVSRPVNSKTVTEGPAVIASGKESTTTLTGNPATTFGTSTSGLK